MGHIKQNNYANYIALKYIFLNLHKKKELPATFGRQLLIITDWRLSAILNYLFRSSASLPV